MAAPNGHAVAVVHASSEPSGIALAHRATRLYGIQFSLPLSRRSGQQHRAALHRRQRVCVAPPALPRSAGGSQPAGGGLTPVSRQLLPRPCSSTATGHAAAAAAAAAVAASPSYTLQQRQQQRSCGQPGWPARRQHTSTACAATPAGGAATRGMPQPSGSDSEAEAPALTTQDEDTIAAIVTGMGHGAIAIIRLSGSEAVDVAAKVFRPNGRFKFDWRPASHRIYYGTVVDGDEQLLDEVLLLPMLSPRSYTCEDVVELHCHGGGVCASRVLRALVEAGARIARPGEFTLRAFLNGRLDLTQAESVTELINARTPGAADSALAGLRGGVGGAVAAMRRKCLDLVAELEARLDFDEDLPPLDQDELRRSIEQLQASIESALRTARGGSLLRRGLQVAIVGRPNVGKSSLLNAWTNSDRAIVTDIAGTTRDVLEASLAVGGVPVTLLDTAGIRESQDVVEKIGVARSQAAASAADIVLMVIDGAAGWTEADAELFRGLWGDGPGSAACRVRGQALLVANKDDLRTTATTAAAAGATAAVAGNGVGAAAVDASTSTTTSTGSNGSSPSSSSSSSDLPLPLVARETFSAVVRTSASQRCGLEALDAELLRLAGAPALASGGISWSVNERQAEALVRAHEALMRLGDSISQGLPLDFWTIDLRAALLALGEVSGDDIAEEVLDNVFSRFCIGK